MIKDRTFEGFDKVYPGEQKFLNNWTSFINLFSEYNAYVKSTTYSLKDGEIAKKIWWCWLQGVENAPDISRICLKSIQYYFKNYEISVVTANNIDEYVFLPKYIKEKVNSGAISMAHFSDIIRILLLVKYGGIWIDSTVLCTGINMLKSVFDEKLFFFSHTMRGDPAILNSSWLLSACKEHPVLCKTRDLLFQYWKKKDTLDNYYLLHILMHIALVSEKCLYEAVPVFSNVPAHIMQDELFSKYDENRFKQLKMMSNFHKLTYKKDMPVGLQATLYTHLLENESAFM